MARKTDKENLHDFTRQIHSTKRTKNPDYTPLENWNEKTARDECKLACRDCRYFFSGLNGCFKYIGKWHKPCDEFEWD